jgi:uncharacterized Fe-S cluster-containing MiaB family protein
MEDRYFKQITNLYERQKAKGLRKYGHTLEDFTSQSFLERIEYLEEELFDGLMYLQWIKELINESK